MAKRWMSVPWETWGGVVRLLLEGGPVDPLGRGHVQVLGRGVDGLPAGQHAGAGGGRQPPHPLGQVHRHHRHHAEAGERVGGVGVLAAQQLALPLPAVAPDLAPARQEGLGIGLLDHLAVERGGLVLGLGTGDRGGHQGSRAWDSSWTTMRATSPVMRADTYVPSSS